MASGLEDWGPPGAQGLPSHYLLLHRRLESNRPLLTRFFKLQFFYVPVKRSQGAGGCTSPASPCQMSSLPADSPRHPSPAVRPQPQAQQGGKARRHEQVPDPWKGLVGSQEQQLPLFMRHILLGGPGSQACSLPCMW